MLALHRALATGVRVEALLAMYDETGERSRSHAISRELMQAQADALGIPLVMRSASWADYESVFIDQLKQFAAQGLTHGVFGDIDLQAHRDWEEKVCAAAGLQVLLPLWQQDRRALAEAVLNSGFRARVVCVDARWLDASFCGVEYDATFLARLPAGVDACGENGEFHTFVFDGPRFAHTVPHCVAAVHELRFEAPAAGHYFSAELVPA